MDDYKEETKAVDEALAKMMEEKSTEAIDEFRERLETFGEKFDAVRKTEVAACFCGEPIDDPTEQEVSPSMYYFNRRTCSDRCHNQWILGQFEGTSRPVGKGWCDIIDQLDRDITEIDPDYSITQVKEKFGTLRFYADFDEPELPLGITNEEVWSIGRMVSDLYRELQKIDDPEGWFGKGAEFEEVPDWKEKQIREDYANLRALRGKLRPIQKLIDEAEALSAKTCEWCGDAGEARSGGWILTLCDSCEEKKEAGIRPWDEDDGTS
jgi:hypothetical protein